MFQKFVEKLERVESRFGRYLVIGVMSLLVLNFFMIARFAWSSFLLQFNDYGFLNYVSESTRHGLFMRAPLPEDHNHFSVHLHLIYLPLIMLRSLFDSNNFLNYVHTFFLAVGSVPLVFMSQKAFRNWFVTLLFVLFYFSNVYVLRCLTAFHFEPLVVPLLLGGFAFLYYERPRIAFLMFLISMTVRDDYGFLIGAAAIAFILFDRKNWRVWLGTGLIGITYFIVAKMFISPSLYNPNHIHANFLQNNWGEYGKSVPEIISYFATHPVWIIVKIFKESEFLEFLKSAYYLPILSPYVLGALPPMAYITTYPANHGQMVYYESSILLPYMFAGSVFSVSTLLKLLGLINKKKLLTAFSIAASIPLAFHLYFTYKTFRSGNNFPVCFLWTCHKTYPPRDAFIFADQKLNELINTNQESVAAAASLFPRVKWRPYLYEDRYWKQYSPCWVLFDFNTSAGNISDAGREQALQSLLLDSRYFKAVDSKGIIFFKKYICNAETERE